MTRFIKIPAIFEVEDKDFDIKDHSTYYIETEYAINIEKIESVYYCKDDNVTYVNLSSGDYYWTFYSVDQIISLVNEEKLNLDRIMEGIK